MQDYMALHGRDLCMPIRILYTKHVCTVVIRHLLQTLYDHVLIVRLLLQVGTSTKAGVYVLTAVQQITRYALIAVSIKTPP